MITTTLNRIRAHKPCEDGWRKLLAGLGKTEPDDEPMPFARILEINGLNDALWACRVEPDHARTWRLFAVWCAWQVEHLMKDERSRHAIDVAERHAKGQAIDIELKTAYAAAYAAAYDPAAAYDAAAAAAAAAAYDAGAGCGDMAHADDAAAYAAYAAAAHAIEAEGLRERAAAAYDAYDAAYANMRREQEAKFRELVS